MGQKVRPTGLRLGITENWRSRWYADKKSFGRLLVEDFKIRRFLQQNYQFAGIPKVEIERTGEEVRLVLHCARPGIIIGRKGQEVERLRTTLEELVRRPVNIDIKEVPRPELDAQLVAQSVAEQLEKRSSFRRTIKRAADMTIEAGALGVKIQVSGRLGGSEMSRSEYTLQGSIPLHTLDANIDYGFTEAKTTYGHIGVKSWIYKQPEENDDAPDAQAGEVPQVPAGQTQR